MSTFLGSVRRLILAPSLADVGFAGRRFPVTPSAVTERLEKIPQAVVCGFEWGIDAKDQWEVERRLDMVDIELRGFAYEGATMAFTVRDAMGGGTRTRDLLLGPGQPHIFLAYIGIGFAMARLPRPLWKKVVPDLAGSAYYPTMSWLAVDGYGFDLAYFHTDTWVGRQRVPRPYAWQGSPDYFPHAVDQGIGRALWFINGGQVADVASAVRNFAAHRHADLWSGVGLAATFAGGVDRAALETLRREAGSTPRSWPRGRSSRSRRATTPGSCPSTPPRRRPSSPTCPSRTRRRSPTTSPPIRTARPPFRNTNCGAGGCAATSPRNTRSSDLPPEKGIRTVTRGRRSAERGPFGAPEIVPTGMRTPEVGSLATPMDKFIVIIPARGVETQLTGALRSLRRRILTPSISETKMETRGFHVKNHEAKDLLETVGETFLAGYAYAVEARTPVEAEERLEQVPRRFRGFAYEGAGMGFGVLDGLPFGGSRNVETFLRGRGDDHLYMVYVGIGWAMARLPRFRWPSSEALDPLLMWLVHDGYGFHQAYFRTREYVHRHHREPRFPWPAHDPHSYADRAIDQGIGRALWFIGGTDVDQAVSLLEKFPEPRWADLWSGIGLAATYAGGAPEEELVRLRGRPVPPAAGAGERLRSRGPDQGGPAGAAQRGGHPGPVRHHPERAAQISRETRPDTAAAQGGLPAYEVWRQNIADQFVSLGGVTS
nr:hypothetical protein GCM10020093_074020 [Planobispora longispora]